MKAERSKSGKSKRAVVVAFAVFATLCALYIGMRVFVATPYAAEWVSGYLGRTLGQRVTVEGLALSGKTLSVREITVASPEGFPGDPLLRVRSLFVSPDLTGIAAGKGSFSLVRIDGLSVDLRRNPAGEWNYREILRSLKRRKKGPSAEISIGSLVFRDVSLKVGGLSLHKIAFSVHDFSTKGSAPSKLIFTGADEKGNPFRLSAEGRLGKDADVNLSIDAPHFSLGTFKEMVRGKPPLDLREGTAGLFLSVTYRSGDAVAKGHLSCDNVRIAVKGAKVPVRSRFDFTARYHGARDEAVLEAASLVVNEKIGMHATGAVRQVRSTRDFLVRMTCDEVRLDDLFEAVPKAVTGDLTLDGSLSCGDLYIAGNGLRGFTSGGGKVMLRNGGVTRGGRPLVAGVSSDSRISRTSAGWRISGTLAANAPSGKLPLEDLRSRFIADFSGTFKPLSFEVPELKAAIGGGTLRGELTYVPERKVPYRMDLRAAEVSLSALNRVLSGKNARFTSGTSDMSIQGSGQGPASFSCRMTGRFFRVAAMASGKSLSLGNGEIVSRLARSGSRVTADGSLKADGGAYSGKRFSGSSAFSVAGRNFSLKGGRAEFDRFTFAFDDIRGRLPIREGGQSGGSLPLSLSLSALDAAAGEISAKGVSGTMTATIAGGAAERKMLGKVDLKLPNLYFRGRPVASLAAHAELNGKDTAVTLDGAAFEGTLTSMVRLDPFAPAKGASFVAAIKNVRAAKLSSLLPPRFPVSVPAGLLSARFEGKWSADEGVHCQIDSSGSEVTFAASGEKPLVTDASVALKANVAGSTLSVSKASITGKDAVSLNLSGGLADFSSPSRKGTFSLEMKSAPVPSLLETLSSILPESLRQSRGEGNIGMIGTLAINGRKTLLEGSVLCGNLLLEYPPQKLTITGVNGSLPFSVYIAGGPVGKPGRTLNFSRANYPALLAEMRGEMRDSGENSKLSIEKVQFGRIEAGQTRIRMKAGGGIVELSAIESSLYGGTVLGQGFVFHDGGLRFGADLLVSDVSLRQFCDSQPALKGYLSGLLDGVVSLYGGKGGLSTLVGFVDLWSHGGKGEQMLVSKDFLQKLAGKNLKKFFFREDRAYDRGEISASLENGYLTFEQLEISHRNLVGMKDLSVSVAPVQNRISLDHLFEAIRKAAARGKTSDGEPSREAPVQTDIEWLE